jgi:hypothetical protein
MGNLSVKASVHCPRPPEYPDFGRHFGFVGEASEPVAIAVRQDGGRHMATWPGCPLGSNCTLEYKVRMRGISLEMTATPVKKNVVLLPIPREHECVDVGVLLGEPTATRPKEIGGATHLLDEGHLSDGRRVWIIYTTLQLREAGEPLPPSTLLTPAKNYLDPSVDFNRDKLRAIMYGPQSDGSLGFMDCNVTPVTDPGYITDVLRITPVTRITRPRLAALSPAARPQRDARPPQGGRLRLGGAMQWGSGRRAAATAKSRLFHKARIRRSGPADRRARSPKHVRGSLRGRIPGI